METPIWRKVLRSLLPIALLIAGFLVVAQPFAVARAVSRSTAVAPKAYIGLFRDNAVAVLDTGTNMVLKTIPVPPGPHGLVITPDGRKVYVSSDGASTVPVIDAATDRISNTIEVGATPHGLAISPDGRQVLVSVFGAAVVTDRDRVDVEVDSYCFAPTFLRGKPGQKTNP